jgi:hypothetical protein
MGAEGNPHPAAGRFRSWAQLRTWASGRLPQATLVTEGLDLKEWNRSAVILDELAAEWPGVTGELGWITKRYPLWEGDPRGVIVTADSLFGEKLAFIPYYFASPRRISKVLRKGVRGGVYPQGAEAVGESYFIAQEWGHLVQAWLRRHDQDRSRRLAVRFLTDPGHSRSSFDQEKASTISDYAARGSTESFAEAFGVIQWQEEGLWPDVVKDFARILRGEP